LKADGFRQRSAKASNIALQDLNIPLEFSSIFVGFCTHLIGTILFQHSEYNAAKLPAKRTNCLIM
jgi:hypothetical protein